MRWGFIGLIGLFCAISLGISIYHSIQLLSIESPLNQLLLQAIYAGVSWFWFSSLFGCLIFLILLKTGVVSKLWGRPEKPSLKEIKLIEELEE